MAAVVLFDGVCNVCNPAVDFILRHDPQGHFRFASLQSDAGRAALADSGEVPEDEIRTIILIEDGRLFRESTAALRIAGRLTGPWSLLYYLLTGVPRPLRDGAYRWFARNRYRWFGKRDTCRLPEPEIRARFLG